MLLHFWKTAVRNLLRNKVFTLINVAGLSISVAVFLALTGYVGYQLSFDRFFPGSDRVYRVNYFEYQQNQPVLQSARTHDRTALLVNEYVPEAEAVTRVFNEKAFIWTERVRIVDQNTLFADSSFLKVFPLELKSGDVETALKAPHSVIISASQAKTYFGDEDPMGKILFVNERLPFTVTGVFEDIPANVTLEYDFILSWSTLTFYGWATRDGNFDAPWAFTFVRLKSHADDIPAINNALSALIMKHNKTLRNRNHTARQELRPYYELHTSNDLSGEIKPSVSRALLYSLVSLAVFVLFGAWINYINLSLARSLERANEIGVRKVFGASRIAISGQFLLEALLLAAITFSCGYGAYKLFTGTLSSLFFDRVTFLPLTLSAGLLYFLAFATATTLFAYYPAHLFSKFKPVLILNNRLGTGKNNIHLFHQTLMVFQLFLAVSIIGISLIATRQIRFMRELDSGLSAQNIITLRAPASTNSDPLRYSRYTSFRNEVLQNPGFRSGTASMNIPGQEIRYHDEAVHAINTSNEKKQSFWIMWIDEGYEETFGLTLVAGRNFKLKESGTTCILNETAALALGFKDPADAVNQNIVNTDQKTFTIVGIWKDYHHESAHKPVDPIIFYHHHPHEYGYYSFNITSREGHYLQELQKIWDRHYPNDQFTYYFMDNFFEEQYSSDELFGKLLSLFGVISVIISSLGLFGMATLSMVKRTKEIGVRKVLGASVWNILVMLSVNYLKLIAVSCLFSFPLAWYLTRQWLNGFAFKVAVQWWMIVLPGIIVLVATLLTISGHSIRAARANPIKSLRDQ